MHRNNYSGLIDALISDSARNATIGRSIAELAREGRAQLVVSGRLEPAARSGFSIDTLRYYEKIGLLSGIARDTAGRRVFTDTDLAWLGMLRCLRDTGMPIAELLRYSELARGGDETVGERVALLQAHDRRVEEQIARLREQQQKIQGKIRFYEQDGEAAAPKETAAP